MVNSPAESSWWLFKSPLAGAGAYCGGRTTGRTGCAVRFYVLCCTAPLSLVKWHLENVFDDVNNATDDDDD